LPPRRLETFEFVETYSDVATIFRSLLPSIVRIYPPRYATVVDDVLMLVVDAGSITCVDGYVEVALALINRMRCIFRKA
jgi:hypothetical protein